MKFAKTVIASFVASGLVAAPVVAQAAPVRAPSAVTESEEMAGGSFLLYLGVLAAAAFLYFVVIEDDETDTSGLPASP